MITKKPIGLGLIAALAALLALAAVASPAGAFTPQLLNKNGGTLLRSVATTPKNAPDAGEFTNVGEVKLATGAGAIVCKELEFGTTVTQNTGTAGTDVILAIPFGVAEGDECLFGTSEVPTYFNTLTNGAVGNAATSTVATVNVNAAGTATFHNLSFTQNIPGGVGFCKGNVDGVTGTVANGTEPFGEEGANGLTVTLTEKEIPITAAEGSACTGLAGTKAKLTATFRLETPSTGTEGWWLG